MQITVTSSSDNQVEREKYDKLNVGGRVDYEFFSVGADYTSKDRKTFTSKDSSNIQITFEMATVQINRPWFDLSILRLPDLTIPGLPAGGWSTGEVNLSNKGQMPLLNTKLVLVRNVTISATKFSQQITDTLKQTDWSTNVGLFVSYHYCLSVIIIILVCCIVWIICYWRCFWII